MRWKRRVRWSWLVPPSLLLVLWPGVSAAQSGVRPDANVLLYEVTENMKIEREEVTSRVAKAALMGTVKAGAPICPSDLAEALGVTSCSITAVASDNINVVTGKGPVRGTFAVIINGDNAVDGAELVILRGTLEGRIDLSPAVLGGFPLGSMTAQWKGSGVENLPSDLPPALGALIAGIEAHGTLEGTFRLPFGTMENAFYLCDAGAQDCLPAEGVLVAPVQPNERSLAVPTVRLEINLIAE